VDRNLFETLRLLRRELAAARDLPAYVVFNDDTLRELARLRPKTLEAMRQVRGIGDNKLRDFGERFLRAIVTHPVS
jgi:ATP-dependent DNA helicase RecQ